MKRLGLGDRPNVEAELRSVEGGTDRGTGGAA
jgi:hypothetical protein